MYQTDIIAIDMRRYIGERNTQKKPHFVTFSYSYVRKYFDRNDTYKI